MSSPNPPSVASVTQRTQSERSLRNSESVVSSDDEGSFFENEGAKAWDKNGVECTICKAQLGKRRMNPRHHCRRCGRCICGKCSLSTVKLVGFKQVQRACSTCAGEIHKSACQRRNAARTFSPLQSLSQQLCELSAGSEDPSPSTLEEAVASCEAAVRIIKRRVQEVEAGKASAEASAQRACSRATKMSQATSDAEAALASCEDSLTQAEAVASTQRAESMEACRSLRERLEHLGGADDASIALAHHPVTVEEAMALCEACLGSVEIRCEQLLQLERDAANAMALLGGMSGPRPLAPPLETTAASFGGSLVANEDDEHDSCANKCTVM